MLSPFLGLFKCLALLSKTKQPHPSPFCPGRLDFRPYLWRLSTFVASSESVQTPARSLSFCAPEETTKKRTGRPRDGTIKEKTLRPTTPVAARGRSPRERSEPPRQPGGFFYAESRPIAAIHVPPRGTSPAISGPYPPSAPIIAPPPKAAGEPRTKTSIL
jgi:hypothetical protein